MQRNLIKLLFVLIAVLPVCMHADSGNKIPPIMKVTYVDKLSSEPVLVQQFAVNRKDDGQVGTAIIRAAQNRGWEVSEEGDEIVAELTHRGMESKLIFRYSAASVEIHSVSYKLKKSGERSKRAEPEGWIRNLHKDILRNLGLI
jgi:hypothetical protein